MADLVSIVNCTQLGKGLCKDEKAQKLALRHWLEAVSSQLFKRKHLSSQYQLNIFDKEQLATKLLLFPSRVAQIDPRHRYGHNLHLYYEVWFASESTQPFFYW